MSVSSSSQFASRIPYSGGESAVRPRRKNQRQRILELLIAGEEVPSPELARISLQYCARISELREAGFVIISRVEIHDGVKHGFFRLHSSPRLAADFAGLR